MADIGTAYVRIEPTAKGISGKIASEMGGVGEEAGKSFGGGFGKVLGGIGKGAAVAIGAASTAAIKVTKSAVDSYAEFEQLEGGISKLFGTAGQSLEQYAESMGQSIEDVSDKYASLERAETTVMNNASNAWKTAGMSANDYMNTVTDLSGAIISSLDYDTEKAAEYADRAIVGMSDIANTYGMTMEDVSSVYSSVSRGIYNTLDNITKGAFAGTKEGYQELIDTMASYTDIQEKLNITVEEGNYDYANFLNAMSVYTEKVNIAGTTAKEASTTISGSLSQTKAAWTNLLTGIANDEADLGELTNNLVDSIVGYTEVTTNGVKTHVNGFLDNIIPVVETSLESIGTLIEKLVPKALNLIPTLINNVLPNITSAATNLVTGLVDALTNNMDSISSVVDQILSALLKLLPQVITLGGQIISTLASAIMDNLDTLLDAAGNIIEMILTGIINNANKLQAACRQIEVTIMNYLTENASMLIQSAIMIVETLLNGLLENLPMLIDAGIQLTMAIFNGLLEALPELLDYLPELVSQVADIMIENTPVILDAATTMFLALVECLPDILIALTQAISEILTSLVDILTGEGSSEIGEAALMCFMEIAAAIPEILGAVIGATLNILQSIYDAIVQYGAQMLTAGTELMMEVGNGLTEAGSEVLTEVVETVEGWVDAVKNTVSDWINAGKSLVEGLWSGFTGTFDSLKSKVSEKLNSLTAMVQSPSVFDINSPSKVFAKIGSSLVEGLEKGWDDDIDDAKKSMASSAKFDASAFNSTSMGLDSNSTAVGTGAPNYITLYATNTLDGQVIGESTYNFTVNKINNQQRALAVAQGGYY